MTVEVLVLPGTSHDARLLQSEYDRLLGPEVVPKSPGELGDRVRDHPRPLSRVEAFVAANDGPAHDPLADREQWVGREAPAVSVGDRERGRLVLDPEGEPRQDPAGQETRADAVAGESQ